MIGKPSSPLLAQLEQKIEASVKPQFRKALSLLVQAGLNYTYSKANQKALQQRIKSVTNPPQDAGRAGVEVAGVMHKQNNRIPMAVMVPGAMLLACEYLDLLSKAGKAQITPQTIAALANTVSHVALQAMNITPQQLDQMVSQGKARAQMKSGIVSAPMQGAQL